MISFAGAEYGVPPKSSKFPAYRLPLETKVRNIDLKCKETPESGGSSESNDSGQKGKLYYEIQN